MICKTCGKEIPDGSHKCPICGGAADSVEHIVYNGLRRTVLLPIVIICIVVFTVMVPWQILFFNSGRTPGDVLESSIRDQLEEDMLTTDGDYYGYSYYDDEIQYFFYSEIDYIDQLYDMANVEPSSVDQTFKTLMVFFVLIQGVSAIGLWIDFYKAQNGEKLSAAGTRMARVCQIFSMVIGLIALLVLFINVSKISNATTSFYGYGRAGDAVRSACSGTNFLLFLAAVLLVTITAMTASALKRISETMETLLPEELPKALVVACFIAAATIFIAGLVEGDFLTVMLPGGAFVVYGITVMQMRERFADLNNTRTVMLMASRHSKKI